VGQTCCGGCKNHIDYQRACNTAAEREANNSKDFCLKNGSSQGRNLAVTVLFVPNSLGSGRLLPDAGLSPHTSSSSLISSLLHSHVNLEWCDKIKLSNLLLPRKSCTIKSLQLLSTSATLLALEQLGVGSPHTRLIDYPL